MDDYIELGPDDVIREGDECRHIDCDEWYCGVLGFGKTVGSVSHNYRFRRPRSVAIRDAAMDLLREEYAHWIATGFVEAFEKGCPKHKALREAMGVTVEELRGK